MCPVRLLFIPVLERVFVFLRGCPFVVALKGQPRGKPQFSGAPICIQDGLACRKLGLVPLASTHKVLGGKEKP